MKVRHSKYRDRTQVVRYESHDKVLILVQDTYHEFNGKLKPLFLVYWGNKGETPVNFGRTELRNSSGRKVGLKKALLMYRNMIEYSKVLTFSKIDQYEEI